MEWIFLKQSRLDIYSLNLISDPHVHVCMTAPANIKQLKGNVFEVRKGSTNEEDYALSRNMGNSSVTLKSGLCKNNRLNEKKKYNDRCVSTIGKLFG